MFELWAIDEYAFKMIQSILNGNNAAYQDPSIAGNITVPRNDYKLNVNDGIAVIPIQGILTKSASGFGLIRMLLGGTTYQEIVQGIQEAESRADVERILLDVDSPGGTVAGAFAAADVIKNASKPVEARISGLAASGAYLLASQADKITAENPADRIGSVGVRISMITSDNVIDITSTKAPFKAPDVKTQAGIEKVREELDMVHDHMASAIARGRDITPDIVNSEFGKGMTLTADIALRRGMIDAIEGGEDMTIQSGRIGASALVRKDGNEPSAGTPPFQDFEIIEKAWDSTAALRRVRRFTNSTDSPSADYKKAFFWYDPATKENFGAYKLPFVDVVDGKLVAIRRGVFAANAAMSGARGQRPDIPESDRAAVQRHIDRYRNKIAKQDNENQRTQKGGFTGMSLQDIFRDNPEAKAEHEEAVKKAVEGERTRVSAHLKNIEHSKDVVIKSITEGKPFDESAISTYMNAAAKHKAGEDATADNLEGLTPEGQGGGQDGMSDLEKKNMAILDGLLAG